MQLHSTDTVLQTNTGARIKAFTIEATAKSFAILSSSLYSDKITAIIRELSCNALDSHVDAGNSDRFIIHLPTSLEPYFYVEDFGTGMSQEMIENLYSTYFSSTKSDRNDQIGALGLGSKSPFAYTDMFTIDSVYNGIQYTYSAAISDKGIPSLVFLNKKEVPGKHTGVKIQFAVNPSDFESFAEKAVYTLWRFTPRPKVIGGSNTYERLMFRFEKDMQIKLQGKDWAFYNSFPRWSDTARVLMGNILYDIRSLASDPMFEKYGAFLDSAFVFEMPLGSCDITPSRETLSFDDLTKKNIFTKLNQISDEISLMLKGKTNDALTLWQAAYEAGEFYRALNLNKGKAKSFYYKEVLHTLGESIPLNCPAFSYDMTTRGYRSRAGKPVFTNPNSISELNLGSKYLIVETLSGKESSWKNSPLKARLRLYSENVKNLDNTTIVFVQGPANLAAWGNPPSIKVQDLPKLKTTKCQTEDLSFDTLYGVSPSYKNLLASDTPKFAYVISYKKRIHWHPDTLENKHAGTAFDDARNYIYRCLSNWFILEGQTSCVVIPYMVWKRLSKTAAFKKKFLPLKEFVNLTLQKKVEANLQELSSLYCMQAISSYYEPLLKRFASTNEYQKLPENSAFKLSMEDLKTKIRTFQKAPTELALIYKFYKEISCSNLVQNLPKLIIEDPYKFFERYPFLSVFFNENSYYHRFSDDSLRSSPFKGTDTETPKISIFEEVYRYINMVEGRVITE